MTELDMTEDKMVSGMTDVLGALYQDMKDQIAEERAADAELDNIYESIVHALGWFDDSAAKAVEDVVRDKEIELGGDDQYFDRDIAAFFLAHLRDCGYKVVMR